MTTRATSTGQPADFLFVGNASYHNRGCEAIVRGTVAILEAATSPETNFTNGFYGDEETHRWQTAGERDPRITHVRLTNYPRKWTRDWAEDRLNRKLGLHFPSIQRPLSAPAAAACGVLEIGGDNYTLDYGFPEHLLTMDRWLTRQGKPPVIWGSSIGPFSEHPTQEARMMAHLRTLPAVFVRESATFDYLANQHGLPNVHQFADPAFALAPAQPTDETVCALVADAPIAVNISPLLAAYRGTKRKMPWETTSDDLQPWVAEAAEMVIRLQQKTGAPILLLPHVYSTAPGVDDFSFLAAVYAKCQEQGARSVQQRADGSGPISAFSVSAFQHLSAEGSIRLLSAPLSAGELKWIIARCRLLVAARTHATIAAFSTGVPTISLGYSRKAVGINQDVFDTADYCLKSSELTPEALVALVDRVLGEEDAIRKHLTVRAGVLKASAMAAGPALIRILADAA